MAGFTQAQLEALIAQFRKETEDLIWASMFQYYFNDGVPYTDTNQVKSIITIDVRQPYIPILVVDVLYWFLPDLTTLVPIFESSTIADGSITLTKLYPIDGISVLGRSTADNGSPEVITIAALRDLLGLVDGTNYNQDLSIYVEKILNYSLVPVDLILKIHDPFAADEAAVIQAILDAIAALVLTDNNYTDEDKAKLDGLNQDVFTINFTSASKSVGTRCAAAIETIDYPTGWVLAPSANPNDLEITHTLGRKIAGVTVFYMDGTEQILLMGSLGYTGVSAPDTNTLVIKGLSVKEFPLTIQLIFA